MATIGINSLPTLLSVQLSDHFDVYNLSGSSVYPQTVSFADFSDFFYSLSSFSILSSKYEELQNLLISFEDFISKNYVPTEALSGIVNTLNNFMTAYNELQTLDKVKEELLNDYATNDYAELKKNEAYTYHETIAADLGTIRGSILESINTEFGSDEDDEEEE